MLNLRPFQIAMLALFGVLGVLAIMLLSGFSPSSTTEEKRFGDRVLVWGTLPAPAFTKVLSDLGKSDKAFDVISYRQVDPRTFNDTFVNAIAEGQTPDLVLLPNTELVRQRSKLLALSYETVSLRDYRDQFVDGAEIFALADGLYARPLGVDPLVMYWNRDLLSSNGLAQPPTTWEYLVSTVVPSLVVRDNARNVSQAAVAMGEFRNVLNAKSVLVLLAIQSGSRLVYEEKGQYKIGLNESLNNVGTPPLTAATQFYTTFNNSNNQVYTWNRAQPLDRNAFVAGDLALYFGFGSELDTIKAQNPNLNFDVTSVPQGAAASVKRSYGVFYGFAIPKASPNPQGAYAVSTILTSPSVSAVLNKELDLAPVDRSVLAAGTADVFRQTIYSDALIARGWLDPNQNATTEVFQSMIEDINAGRSSVGDATGDVIQKVRLVF